MTNYEEALNVANQVADTIEKTKPPFSTEMFLQYGILRALLAIVVELETIKDAIRDTH